MGWRSRESDQVTNSLIVFPGRDLAVKKIAHSSCCELVGVLLESDLFSAWETTIRDGMVYKKLPKASTTWNPRSQLFTVQVKISVALEVSSTFIQHKQSFKVSHR